MDPSRCLQSPPAADVTRVLEINRQAGRFVKEEAPPGEAGLTRRLWDAMELDRN